jgi:glycosyltransferase involved in cell wall biosynthesis
MNIVMIGPFPNPINGCSLANKILYRFLQNSGNKITFINTSTQTLSSRQGNFFSVKKFLSFLINYTDIHKIIKADVVYITPGQTFFGLTKYSPFMSFALLLNKPYVLHLHGNYLGNEYKQLKGLKKIIFKKYINKCSAAIVLSDSLRTNFKDLLHPSKVFVVENFVEDYLLTQPKNPKKTDVLKILFLSNLLREKGIIVLLESLNLLEKKGIKYEAHLAGHIENNLSNEINSYLINLKKNVTYHGPIYGEKKHNLLEYCNVFVLPTYYSMEGQPISILEALATGNIIITTKHAGIPEIVGDKHGYFIPLKDHIALANILEKISYDIKKEMSLFSESNRKYARLRFTEDKFGSKILSILKYSITINKSKT